MTAPRNGAMRNVVVALALLAAAIASASGQGLPDRPIKIIAPFTPGSPNDVVARLIAPSLTTLLGQSVVIDNRPGGGTSIGLKAVMAADPDGTTLLISNSPTHFIAPLPYSLKLNMPYRWPSFTTGVLQWLISLFAARHRSAGTSFPSRFSMRQAAAPTP